MSSSKSDCSVQTLCKSSGVALISETLSGSLFSGWRQSSLAGDTRRRFFDRASPGGVARFPSVPSFFHLIFCTCMPVECCFSNAASTFPSATGMRHPFNLPRWATPGEKRKRPSPEHSIPFV